MSKFPRRAKLMRATPRSMGIARQIADRLGQEMDDQEVERDASRILTLYFTDIIQALSPQFDDIEIREFTLRRIDAYADREPEADDAFVHIDQQFDIWLSGLLHLWCVRAFHVLDDEKRKFWNALFVRHLDMRDDPMTHEALREDMLPFFLDYTDALRVSHDLSLWGIAFIACHELAHHHLNHLGQEPSHALEYQADMEGYRLLQRVAHYEKEFVTIRKQPYALTGAYATLSMIDLSERRQAQRVGSMERQKFLSHPWAEDRLAKLLPLLREEPNPYVAQFLNGFGGALEDIVLDLKLGEIA